MKQLITNRFSGHVFGIYEGTKTEAMEELAKDAGYESAEEARRVLGGASGNDICFQEVCGACVAAGCEAEEVAAVETYKATGEGSCYRHANREEAE